MKKYHYATVPLTAFCALAKVPAPVGSFIADDSDSRTVSDLLNSGYRLAHTFPAGDAAIFEKQIETVSPPFELAMRGLDDKTVIREMLEAAEELHGAKVCDCWPEPENAGHVCCWCKARLALEKS